MDTAYWSTSLIGLTLAVLIAVIWGLSDFFSGEVVKRASTSFYLASLYLFEFPLVLVVVIISGQYGMLNTNLLFFAVGILGIGGIGFLAYGIAHGYVSIVCSITGLLALAIPAVFSVIIGQTTSWLVWCGLAVACIAILCITYVKESHREDNHAHKFQISIISGLLAGSIAGVFLTVLGHVTSPIGIKVFMIEIPGFLFSIFLDIEKRKMNLSNIIG